MRMDKKQYKMHKPQCLHVKEKTPDTESMKTFVDASEAAYVVVVCIWYTCQDRSVSTDIVALKIQIAPSNALSITRLGLMGNCYQCSTFYENIENS